MTGGDGGHISHPGNRAYRAACGAGQRWWIAVRAPAYSAIHHVCVPRLASGRAGEMSLFARWPDTERHPGILAIHPPQGRFVLGKAAKVTATSQYRPEVAGDREIRPDKACRPERYKAIISCPASRSRSGYCRPTARSSPTNCRCLPCQGTEP